MMIQKINHSLHALLSTWGGSLRFTVAICAFFSLWMSVIDIVNCFQNTIRDINDEVFMSLPPSCKKWFKLCHPNIKLPENKEKLIMQLLNVCQGSVDAGQKWNELFDKALGKMNITRSSRDLVVRTRRIDGDLATLNVSTDDVLI